MACCRHYRSRFHATVASALRKVCAIPIAGMDLLALCMQVSVAHAPPRKTLPVSVAALRSQRWPIESRVRRDGFSPTLRRRCARKPFQFRSARRASQARRARRRSAYRSTRLARCARVSKDVRCAEPRMAAAHRRESAGRAPAALRARPLRARCLRRSRTRRPCCRAPDRHRSGDAVERRPVASRTKRSSRYGFEWRHPRPFAICVPRRNDEASTCPAPDRQNERAAWDLQRLKGKANDLTSRGTFEKLTRSFSALRDRASQRRAADVRSRRVAAPRGKSYRPVPWRAGRTNCRPFPRTGAQHDVVVLWSDDYGPGDTRSAAAQTFSSRVTAAAATSWRYGIGRFRAERIAAVRSSIGTLGVRSAYRRPLTS